MKALTLKVKVAGDRLVLTEDPLKAQLVDAVWAFIKVLERWPFTGYQDIRNDYGKAEVKALLEALAEAEHGVKL